MVLDAAADSTWTCRYIAILLLLTEMRYISLIPTSLIFYFLKKLLKTSCLDYIIIFYPLFLCSSLYHCCNKSYALWSYALWRSCEVSNLCNSSTNWIKVVPYMGHLVEFPWGIVHYQVFIFLIWDILSVWIYKFCLISFLKFKASICNFEL